MTDREMIELALLLLVIVLPWAAVAVVVAILAKRWNRHD